MCRTNASRPHLGRFGSLVPYHAATRFPIFQFDAFSTRRFAGNPAAIWERGLAGRGPVPAPARSERMRHNARALDGHLKSGLTQSMAAEIMWTYSSPDLYDLLVARRGWSLPRFGQFVTESLLAALLP